MADFRIYEIGIDGQGLRPLTGGPDDAGCTALPPMRYAPDGKTILPDDERRRIDFDDVDPVFVDTGNSLIAFASSRTPDLGRGHSRRSTTLWVMYLNDPAARKFPLTANRHNDRWPFHLTSNFLAFSMWSRNQEVITADESDVRPYEAGKAWATAPLDHWTGAFAQPTGAQIGALVRPHVPVWRCRPLFNGRLAFMTTFTYASFNHNAPKPAGVLGGPGRTGTSARCARAPSDRPADPGAKGLPFMARTNRGCRWPTAQSRHAEPLSPGHVLLAGAPISTGNTPTPAAYGIYLAHDDWETNRASANQ